MRHELPNIEAILLGIVNENPSYAYEIDKTIDSREMRYWVKIGVASIYQALKKLEDKKLVFSQREKEGRMPERKRYYITTEGKAALADASKRLLSGFEWHYLDLNVGLETSDLLTDAEIAGCLKERLAMIRANKKKLSEILKAGNNEMFKKKAVIRSLLYFRKTEESLLNELLAGFTVKQS